MSCIMNAADPRNPCDEDPTRPKRVQSHEVDRELVLRPPHLSLVGPHTCQLLRLDEDLNLGILCVVPVLVGHEKIVPASERSRNCRKRPCRF
jgi:hypothetical protein